MDQSSINKFLFVRLSLSSFCLPIAYCLLLILASCNNQQNKQENVAKSEQLYTCSMHPQVRQHDSGNCPICGMKLITLNDTSTTKSDVKLESLLKPANEFVIGSLPVTTAQEKDLAVPIKVYGTIEYDARAAGTISARVSGRIEKLYLRYRYQEVRQGQKVMDIYSPELVTAQQNLLFLLKSDPDNTSFINAAEQKLLLLGMTQSELNKVIHTGKPLYSVSVYSSYSGHLHDAAMSNNVAANDMNTSMPITQELMLKEGMYVQKGEGLFMIMSHHQTWVALQIFGNDQPLVERGDAVRIIPEADTAAVINGKIDFIEPFFRSGSKTLTARVYFHNMAMLPVGSHVTAYIYSGDVKGVWLPASAVVSLGANEIAFKKEENGFLARQVVTGIRLADNVQIISGLDTNDTVALNAQYLVDSESFVRPASKN